MLAAFSIALVISAIAGHVVAWRILRPRQHFVSLLVFFAVWLAATIALATAAAGSGAPLPAGWIDWLHVVALYVPAVLAYTSLFSLIEQDSPSLSIVGCAAGAGSSGCSRDALLAMLDAGGSVVQQRLLAARDNGLLRGDLETGWSLTPKGRIVARVSALASALYRLEQAG